jgi:hypothetical protein
MVAGLIAGGVIGVVIVLYAADRIIKARAQVRRLRSMSQRLAAASARAEEQHQQRQADKRAGQALTSVLPAIKRPPLTVPGMRGHGAAPPRTGRECPAPHDGRSRTQAVGFPAPASTRPGPAARHVDQAPAQSSPVAKARTRPETGNRRNGT